MVFTEADDHVDFSDKPSLNITGPLTVETWVNPETLGWDVGRLMGTSVEGFLLAYRTGIGPSQAERGLCQWHIGGGDNIRAKLRIRQWNHVVGTFDGNTMELWINGRLVASRHSDGPAQSPGTFTLLFCHTRQLSRQA